jgi:LPS sulfotransferase NodH
MDRTGVLGHPREWLNLRELQRMRPGKVAGVADCCRLIRHEGTTANGIAATKLLANHYLRLDGGFVANNWFSEQRWIHLRRRDRLGQAISRTIAVQSGRWAETMGNEPTARLVAYSRRQIDANLEEIDQADRMWADYFAAESIEPLALWYEDLEQDLHQPLEKMAIYVGGEALLAELRRSPPFLTGSFDIGLVRQRDATNVEWRVRYLRGM